ncbi:hypothetical protein MMC07_003142 [Pseudocyphellaria aurata]|nr:hypothetical protein [Pseudocyphellaria aurata]
MSSRCTSCLQTRELSFFQPRRLTTDESKILKTCSLCCDRARRFAQSRKNRSTATELNATNVAPGDTLAAGPSALSIPTRRPQENNDDDTLHPAVRRCREVMASLNLPPQISPREQPSPNPLPSCVPSPDVPPSPPASPDQAQTAPMASNLPPLPPAGPVSHRRRLSMDSDASFQKKYGFQNNCQGPPSD